MRFTCKFILANRAKEDGTKALCLQAIINRKRAVLPLGFSINEKHFDLTTRRVKRSHPNSVQLNKLISKAEYKAMKIATDFADQSRFLTPDQFRDAYRRDDDSNVSFTAFTKSELQRRQLKTAISTHRQHQSFLNKLGEFRASIHFADLTIDLLHAFEGWLIGTKKNDKNTVNKMMKIMKVYINAAIDQGIKFANPFERFRIREVKPSKTFLSKEEMTLLVEYYNKDIPEPHRRVLRYFLFSCLSGMRISDVQAITWNHVHGESIIYHPAKTAYSKKAVTVFLSKYERALMPAAGSPGAKIFDVMTEQATNRMLKDIAIAAGIKKKVTYHISRHTFATRYLEEGGSIETLKEHLGHQQITTTMVYSHMTTTNLRNQKLQATDKMDLDLE